MSFFSSRRRRIFFGILLLLIPLALYRIEPTTPPPSMRWYQKPLFWITHPVVSGIRTIQQAGSDLVRHYVFLTQAARQNDELRRIIDTLESREDFYQSVQAENERLTGLLEFQRKISQKTVSAKIISYPPLGEFRLMTLNKGSESGIERGAAVLSPKGLVGRIFRVEKGASQVLLLTDPTSSVDARIRRTEARGLVVGRATELGLEREMFVGALEFWDRSEEIQNGDLLETSGLDAVFPAEIPIGYVQSLKKGDYEVFQEGIVIPIVDFNKLREVFIYLKP